MLLHTLSTFHFCSAVPSTSRSLVCLILLALSSVFHFSEKAVSLQLLNEACLFLAALLGQPLLLQQLTAVSKNVPKWTVSVSFAVLLFSFLVVVV